MSTTICHEAPRPMVQRAVLALSLLALVPAASPVAAQAVTAPPATYAAPVEIGEDEQAVAILTPDQLGELVAPVALYPDDLLSVVLPASTYPLQVVQAARFLTARQSNPTLQPDAAWDDSVVALLNYPDVVTMMDKDLDWTWRLGQAVIAQRAEVLTAVSDFRARAQAAGNLRSDERQIVDTNEGAIAIRPANPQLIYVPYYEPTQVVVYQSTPVYHYYPRPYPVYYYPYDSGYPYGYSSFFGLTSAFSIGWLSHDLFYHHHGHRHHPYRHHRYDNRYYRGPHRHHGDHHDGDGHHRGGRDRDDYVWQPDRHHGGARPDSGGRGNSAAGGGRGGQAQTPPPVQTIRQVRNPAQQAPATWQDAVRRYSPPGSAAAVAARPSNDALPVDTTPRLGRQTAGNGANAWSNSRRNRQATGAAAVNPAAASQFNSANPRTVAPAMRQDARSAQPQVAPRERTQTFFGPRNGTRPSSRAEQALAPSAPRNFGGGQRTPSAAMPRSDTRAVQALQGGGQREAMMQRAQRSVQAAPQATQRSFNRSADGGSSFGARAAPRAAAPAPRPAAPSRSAPSRGSEGRAMMERAMRNR